MMKKIQGMKYVLLALGLICVEQAPTFFLKPKQPLWQAGLLIFLFLLISFGTVKLGKHLNIISSQAVLRQWRSWKITIIGLLILFSVQIVGGIVLTIENGGNSTANQSALEELSANPLLLFTIIVIVAPIVEEIVFRGLLLNKTFHFSYVGIIVSSFLFGLLHFPTNFGSWIIYGGMGLVLGLVYKRTGKIEHAFMIHFLNNLIGIIPLLL
ncbi:CPBP family intramembrane glutamic endopeptidase [Streptococcus pantholopis]|uniref:CAAX protease n=1 Tax=Streptococcus pantholopis TaxID=1811193 RepID=A0A172QA12_9STRE|nr:type II CAAX endopeptidase family protein [Streptococcus pantholopis]AND80258.1 CAAX protease [Streptococcus pantholopis]